MDVWKSSRWRFVVFAISNPDPSSGLQEMGLGNSHMPDVDDSSKLQSSPGTSDGVSNASSNEILNSEVLGIWPSGISSKLVKYPWTSAELAPLSATDVAAWVSFTVSSTFCSTGHELKFCSVLFSCFRNVSRRKRFSRFHLRIIDGIFIYRPQAGTPEGVFHYNRIWHLIQCTSKNSAKSEFAYWCLILWQKRSTRDFPFWLKRSKKTLSNGCSMWEVWGSKLNKTRR